MHGYPVARTSAPQDPRSKARANPTCRSCMSFQDHHPGATWSSGKYSRECLNLLCHCEIVRKDLRPIPSLRIYHERIFTSRLSLSRWWLTQTPRSFLFVRDTLGSTPGDATVASQLRVRNAYPQEWACIRNRACLLTGYEASPHPTSKHATSAASIPVRSLSSTVGTVGILARAFRPIIACAPTLWKSGIDAAYLADPQV